MSKLKKRCAWAQNDPQMQAYHDDEWGRPEYDSRALWEALMLDGFQAGLAWITILRKREGFRNAFHNFDPQAIARFDENDIERLMQDARIVRSRAKIRATIEGAKIYVAMEASGESFSAWVWGLAGGQATAQSLQNGDRCPGEDTDLGDDIRVPEEARIQVCGAGNRVRVDAGRRHGG